MALTIRTTGKAITVIPDGSSDFDLPTNLSEAQHTGLMVKAIMIKPSGTDDVLILKDSKTGVTGTATAATILHCQFSSVYDTRVFLFPDGQQMWPLIDYSDCTVGTDANFRITFLLA